MAFDDPCATCGHWRCDHEPGHDQDTSCSFHGCQCLRFAPAYVLAVPTRRLMKAAFLRQKHNSGRWTNAGIRAEFGVMLGGKHTKRRRVTTHDARRFVWAST